MGYSDLLLRDLTGGGLVAFIHQCGHCLRHGSSMAVSLHRYQSGRPGLSGTPSSSPGACSMRSTPRMPVTAVVKQGHSSTTTPGSQQQADVIGGHDPTSLCVLLPNGRQFQIQVVVGRGGQPRWSFSGLGGLLLSQPMLNSEHAVLAEPPIAPGPLPAPEQPWQQLGQQEEQQQQHWQQQEQQWQHKQLFNHQHDLQQHQAPVNTSHTRQAAIVLSRGAGEPAAEAAAAPAETDKLLGATSKAPELLPWSFSEGDQAETVAGLGQIREQEQQQQQKARQHQQHRVLMPEQQTAKVQHRMFQQERYSGVIEQGWLQQQGLLEPQQQQQQLQEQQQQQLSEQQHKQQSVQPRVGMQQQQWQQQHLLAAVAGSSGRTSWQQWKQNKTAALLDQLTSAVSVEQVLSSVKLNSNSKAFTPEVTSAALVRLQALATWQVIEAVRKGDVNHDWGYSGQQQQQQRRRHMYAGLSSSSTNSSSRAGIEWPSCKVPKQYQGPAFDTVQGQEQGLADAKQWQQHHQQQQQQEGARQLSARPAMALKRLMGCFLKLIHLLESHAAEVSGASLLAAAQLSARLVGSKCKVHRWWAAANGYLVLGEAARRWKTGNLGIVEGVEICYSYLHCGYNPISVLRPLITAIRHEAALLDDLTVHELCHLTYCATNHKDKMYVLNGPNLAAQVLQRLQQPGIMQNAKPYDLAMLMRHLCQLDPQVPEGFEQGLLPGIVARMPMMTMQELTAVLHVAVEWQLHSRWQLAGLAAGLVIAAVSMPSLQQQCRHDQVLSAGQLAGGDVDACQIAQQQQHYWQLQQLCQQQREQWQQLPSDVQQQWKRVPALLVSRYLDLQQQLQQAQQQQQQQQGADHSQQCSITNADKLITSIHQQMAQLQEHAQVWTAAVATASGQQYPRTAADPVILLHRFCQCGYHPPMQLYYWLLQKLAPKLHLLSVLQANLLSRALLWKWQDSYGCEQLLQLGLGPWLQNSGTRGGGLGKNSSDQSTSVITAAAGQQDSGLHAELPAIEPKLLELPYWQLKALLIAAGRFGPLAAQVEAERQQQQQQWQWQQQQQGAASSSSSSNSSDGAWTTASTFVNALLRHLSRSNAGCSQLITWRADVVLALFWAAARLEINPEPQLLEAGCAALAARMRQQIGPHELVHLVWTAAVLHLKHEKFLDMLCKELVTKVWQGFLHPKSIASAAWALVQLRCPHTAVLDALSKALLRSQPLKASHEVLRAKTWHRGQQQLLQQGSSVDCLQLQQGQEQQGQEQQGQEQQGRGTMVQEQQEEQQQQGSSDNGLLQQQLQQQQSQGTLFSEQQYQQQEGRHDQHQQVASTTSGRYYAHPIKSDGVNRAAMRYRRGKKRLMPTHDELDWTAASAEPSIAAEDCYTNSSRGGSTMCSSVTGSASAVTAKSAGTTAADLSHDLVAAISEGIASKQQQRREAVSPADINGSSGGSIPMQGLQTCSGEASSSGFSSSNSSGNAYEDCGNSDLWSRHPLVCLLGPPDLAKLAGSCVMAGWAPPQLLMVLAVRAVQVMHSMQPAPLAELMWAYAAARCHHTALLHAAASRAADLAGAGAFINSRQPLALLGAFRALGLSGSEADALLLQEIHRLKRQEAQQHQQVEAGRGS